MFITFIILYAFHVAKRNNIISPLFFFFLNKYIQLVQKFSILSNIVVYCKIINYNFYTRIINNNNI